MVEEELSVMKPYILCFDDTINKVSLSLSLSLSVIIINIECDKTATAVGTGFYTYSNITFSIFYSPIFYFY